MVPPHSSPGFPLQIVRFRPKTQKSISITLRISIILSNIVGAPTFLSRDRTTKDQQLIDPGTVFSSHCGLSAVNCFSPLTPIIPAHTRRSPISPIIPALTKNMGGGGVSSKMCSCVTLLFSYTVLTTQLSKIVGAPSFSFLHATHRLHLQPNTRGTERSLDYATRRATVRRGRENRVAPLGMTATSKGKRNPRAQAGVPVPPTARERRARCIVPLRAGRRLGQQRGVWC